MLKQLRSQQKIWSAWILAGLILISMFAWLHFSFAQSNDNGDVNINLNVPGCNLNGICEAPLEEDNVSCPLDCPLVTPPIPDPVVFNESRSSGNRIFDITVTVGTTTAVITWRTEISALTTLSWGLTPDYTSGAISEVLYLKKHRAVLTDLEPGTLYYFKIQGRDIMGVPLGISGLTFHTFSPDYVPPNISLFKATVLDESYVVLTWRNSSPQYPVRIVRSDIFYPTSPYEGKVVFEGFGSRTEDHDVLKGKIYYYTAFVDAGNKKYSSGVMAVAYIPSRHPIVDLDEPIRVTKPEKKDHFLGTQPNILLLPLTDVTFLQQNTKIKFSRNVPLQSTRATHVVVPKEKIPEGVETVVVHVALTTNPTESVLFFLNRENELFDYSAVMGPLFEHGRYAIEIVGLNDVHQQVVRIDGFLDISTDGTMSLKLTMLGFMYAHWNVLMLVLIAFILLVILYIWFRRMMRRKKR
jgi:hypothetical protein